MRDTTPEITERVYEMIRKKSPLERVLMGCSMYETSKQLVIRVIREEHPLYGADYHPVEREKIARHLEAHVVSD